ncbi:MAG: hypothetical protein AAF558_12940, partial [Verrucomicrobiota bacterium]
MLDLKNTVLAALGILALTSLVYSQCYVPGKPCKPKRENHRDFERRDKYPMRTLPKAAPEQFSP